MKNNFLKQFMSKLTSADADEINPYPLNELEAEDRPVLPVAKRAPRKKGVSTKPYRNTDSKMITRKPK